MRLQINYHLRTGLIIIIEQGLKHTGEGYIMALVNTHRGYMRRIFLLIRRYSMPAAGKEI